MKLFAVAAVVAGVAIGSALRAQSYTFSTATTAVYSPGGAVVDPSGAIFVSASYSNSVYKLSPAGAVLSQYGSYSSGSVDGSNTNARFYNPRGLALDGAGNLYVADTNNHTIRKVTPAGVVSTLAGSPGVSGFSDNTVENQATNARFFYPQGLAIDSAGNLYVADTNNHTIRRITPTGIVSTFAGSPGILGSVDGTGSDAQFNLPQGLAIDGAGNLYVADTGNSTIRKITPGRIVTTVAGSALNFGAVDGPVANARLYSPRGVAIDAAGNIFVADTTNLTIRKIAGGNVTTIGGLAGNSGDSAGLGSAARFYGPNAVAVGGGGDLLIADSTYLKLGVASSQLAITVQPQSLSVGSGSSARLSVTATGATPFTYQWQKNGAPIAGATESSLTISSVQSADAATYTVTVNNALGTLASAGATLTVLAPVPNDNFASAQVISGASGNVSGNNNGATGEPGEPTHGAVASTASSVWYKWTPAESGTAVFRLNSSGFVMAVWSGTSVSTLTRVPLRNGGFVSFAAQRGTSYYIAVGSLSTTSRGNFTFDWNTLFNDDFANAQTLSANSGSVSGTNLGASTEAGEPTSPRVLRNTVWYRWTPTQSGTALLDLPLFLGFDATVFTGNSLATLTPVTATITFNPVVNGTTLFRRAVNVEAGTPYYIAVSTNDTFGAGFTLSWQITTQIISPTVAVSRTVQVGSALTLGATYISSTPVTLQWLRDGRAISGATAPTLALTNIQPGDAGTYVLRIDNGAGRSDITIATITVLTPPANDNFAAATAINGLNGQITGTNVNATGETGEPAHWSFSGTASSVWYRWTPGSSGLAAIDTVGSNFDTVLAIYTGSSLASLTRLAQDDDRGGGRTSLVSFAATAGTTYYIAIGGATSGARGNITLNWQLTPTLTVATQPISQTIAAGGSATFSVTASGAGVTYQWYRNGTAIPGATTSTLTIANVQGGADASYTVTVTNSSGSVTSTPATLTVAAPNLTALSTRHATAGGGMLWSVAANGNTLVAVGDGGAIISSADKGRTWTPRISGNTAWLVAVTYGNGQFVVVGAEGRILTSPDGVAWTAATAPATRERLNNVIYADDQYVAIGEHGTVVTSADARTWTLRTTPVNTWLHGLAYHRGIRHFITSGEAGVLLTSPDAVTWTRLPVPDFTGEMHHIVAVDSYAHFVVAGAQGKVISVRQNQLLLKDGQSLTTWTAEANATNTSAVLIGMVQGAGALFATTDDGQVITAANDHGPWYAVRTSVQGYLLAGIYHENRLYIVGREETVLESDPIYATRLVNISTRGQVGTGGDILISGFIVTGSAPKQILVRAVGPALGGFGVTGQLAAPVLTLFNGSGRILATNQGWSNATNSAAISTTTTAVGAFPLATGSGDCAILTTLEPGTYTAQIAGINNTTGIALVEAYDTEPLSIETSRAINVSTRGVVGAGQGKMIAGFIIDGSSARRVLIRAVGPALAGFGVAGTVAEPQLELYTSRGLLQSSAGAWGLQTNADEIRGATQQINAFAFAEGSKDSAMLVTLLPGSWTVQVGGAAGTSGVALVEVYMLP